MIPLLCKSCGGALECRQNLYFCPFCGVRWMIDAADDVHAVERANAWEALRTGNFDTACELFERIIYKQPDDYEAYWGKALSEAGIVYVTDYDEQKRVPTVNNITDQSFCDRKEVVKAISLAPFEIAEDYKKQAEYIDRVRKEWIEKASREPAYDIFISYKDSDRENGILRTDDSIDAQELYTILTERGYKVFFSRISLRNKISEQYEPYIYNAIKTAKVMIVFGEKEEYFSSPWIKNEWKRFAARIEKGEKRPNSLVVVYKDVDPEDLPIVLRSKQCIDFSNIVFLHTLLEHIQKVIKQSQNASLYTSKNGFSDESTTDDQAIDALLTTAWTQLKERRFKSAETLFNKIIDLRPQCSSAYWGKLLSAQRCDSDEALSEDRTVEGYLDELLENAHTDAANASPELARKSLENNWGSSFASACAYANEEEERRYRECFDAALKKLIEAIVDEQKNAVRAKKKKEEYRKLRKTPLWSFLGLLAFVWSAVIFLWWDLNKDSHQIFQVSYHEYTDFLKTQDIVFSVAAILAFVNVTAHLVLSIRYLILTRSFKKELSANRTWVILSCFFSVVVAFLWGSIAINF